MCLAVINRFKYCQNAPFTVLVFIFSAVPNRFKSRHNAYFGDIVFNFYSAVPNRFKYRQNACLRDIVFKMFSAVPNRFKYRQDAYFLIVLIFFCEVTNNKCQIACFRDIVFQNVLCSFKSDAR